jgi:hypothetical protein
VVTLAGISMGLSLLLLLLLLLLLFNCPNGDLPGGSGTKIIINTQKYTYHTNDTPGSNKTQNTKLHKQ